MLSFTNLLNKFVELKQAPKLQESQNLTRVIVFGEFFSELRIQIN
jgi:hypothetical protein